MIYFVQGVLGGPVKIGFCAEEQQLGRRLKELQVGSPVRLQVTNVMDGSREDEQLLHARFNRSRLHGEWFQPVAPLAQLARALDEAEGLNVGGIAEYERGRTDGIVIGSERRCVAYLMR